MRQLIISPKVDKGIKSLSIQVQELDIVDQKSAIKAGDLVKVISDLKGKVEAQRLEFTKPLNESLKNINSFFKQFSYPLIEFDKIARSKLIDYEKTGESGEENKFGEIHFVARETIEIIDEAKIPTDYLMPDMRKNKKAVSAGVQIPGIKVIKEKGVSL